MPKRGQYCGLLIFSLLLCQTAAYGLILTGRWLYLLALITGAIACSGCLKLLLEQKPAETRVEHHYHLYYTSQAPNRDLFPNNLPPSRW